MSSGEDGGTRSMREGTTEGQGDETDGCLEKDTSATTELETWEVRL